MSDKRPLPFYRWYVLDYRASRPVQRMSYIERGLYRELLDECWLEGAIPDDPARLAEICGCPVGVMAEAWPTLKMRFTPLPGMDGTFLTKDRLEVERTEIDKLRTVRALAGRKGGRAKANASKGKQTVANQPAVAEHEQSSSIPLVTQAAEQTTAPTGQPTQLAAVLASFKAGRHVG